MTLRFIRYPATPMVLLAAAYAFLASDVRDRVQTFAMLSLTAVGVTEAVLAAVALFRPQSRGDVLNHSLLAAGALVMGYSLLEGLQVIPFVCGAVVLTIGLVDFSRRLHATSKLG